MALPERTSQEPASTEEKQSISPLGERVARLEGAYEHLATKADVNAVRTDIEKVRTEVESVRTEVESVRTDVEGIRGDIRALRWMLGILIAAASVGVGVVNVVVALALRT